MGKGSKRRPMQISREEHELRLAYAHGQLKISEKECIKRINEIREKEKVKKS